MSFLIVFIFAVNTIAQIKVKTTDSDLSLRSKPTTSSKILYKLPNESELLYANDWAEGWIKVRYYIDGLTNEADGNKEIDVTGWVNLAFIETHFFKSTILDTMSWGEFDGYWGGIYGVNGLLGIDDGIGEMDLKVKIKGTEYILKKIDSNSTYFKWEHPKVKIEFFGAATFEGYEESESKGILRIEYNGKVEFIYAALGEGS